MWRHDEVTKSVPDVMDLDASETTDEGEVQDPDTYRSDPKKLVEYGQPVDDVGVVEAFGSDSLRKHERDS